MKRGIVALSVAVALAAPWTVLAQQRSGGAPPPRPAGGGAAPRPPAPAPRPPPAPAPRPGGGFNFTPDTGQMTRPPGGGNNRPPSTGGGNNRPPNNGPPNNGPPNNGGGNNRPPNNGPPGNGGGNNGGGNYRPPHGGYPRPPSGGYPPPRPPGGWPPPRPPGYVIVNPGYRGPAWGWNSGYVWAPYPSYWGGGFWGPFALGALTGVVINSALNEPAPPPYYQVAADSPGAQLLANYELTQTPCGPPDLVVMYGPDGSVICAFPNNLVGPGNYNINYSNLTLQSN